MSLIRPTFFRKFGISRWSILNKQFSSNTTEKVPIIFQLANDDKIKVEADIGKSLLDVAHENDVDLEGACGGEMACSTCHLILEKSVYDKLPKPCDEEHDMLDLAVGLTETSRLGCQIKVSKDLEGATFKLSDLYANLM